MDHSRTRGRGGWEGWVVLGDGDFGLWAGGRRTSEMLQPVNAKRRSP